MSNRWRSHTSEKLFLAGIQLAEWQSSGEYESSIVKPREESFKQSAILLIVTAWEGFLNELADYHQQKSEGIATLDQLVALIGRDIPEIEYLVEIKKCDGSWLSDLLLLNKIIRTPQNRESDTLTLDLADNALIATSRTHVLVDSVDNIDRIREEFKGYLEALRSRMSEW